MENNYPSNIIEIASYELELTKAIPGRKIQFLFSLLIFSFSFTLPVLINGQNLTFSYSYQNISRNSSGGTLETGDTIEVHALVKVDVTTSNFYYIDTIRTGTQYVDKTLRVVTNEGLTYLGPYTSASGDDKGIYISTGTPRLRVNLGTSASNVTTTNFSSTSGGGTITPGDKPKFYGTTLFMVAYKLVITASYGDTIHLTGDYYFSKTDGITHYRFNYPGIKIIKNSGFCNNFESASFTADSSFGSGTIQNRALPILSDTTEYSKINMGANAPGDGYYAIANNTSADGTTDNTGPYKPTTNNHRVFGGYWDIIGDHTSASDPSVGNAAVAPGTNGGYMLVVNAAFPTGEAYRQTIYGLCPNTNYEFSAWVRNICGVCGIDMNSNATYTPGVLPNLSFAINDIDYYTSGDILHDNLWHKRGFLYKTGPTETSFTISIKNNAAGGGGNDWVMDDINLVTCYPNLVMNPSDTATACAGWPITISDTIKSYFDNYTNYRWETSSDGVNWTPVNSGSTRTPTLENGLYVYHVDTVLVPTKTDSATFLRIKVGTTTDNLADGNCSVDNSQKVFLKVYSTNCPLLDVSLLNFYAVLFNENPVLKWSAQSENNLSKYEIERSTDGIHFTNVGGVPAKNEQDISSYIFNDETDVSNVVFYRLKLVNKNNKEIKYSKIVSVYNSKTPFTINVINPFRNRIKMNLFVPQEGVVEINLCDIFGNIVKKKTLQLHKGYSEENLDDLGMLPAGIYFLRAAFNGNVVQRKLMKSN
ncbi:MAG TPA: T9SS type A sorting domain-containing protein [Hanamia sp.]|nr:T9SS type A sorting domain-containing protein [Hanamia sp.]